MTTAKKPPADSSNIAPNVATDATPHRVTRRRSVPSKPARKTGPPRGDELDAAILRFLRAKPNEPRDLDPLAAELGVEPIAMQLAVERLHQRRMVVVPFIEPGRAGGAELTAIGLRWLIEREGGKPKDTPVAFQPAKGHVRASDEAARLPRAQVYGVRR